MAKKKSTTEQGVDSKETCTTNSIQLTENIILPDKNSAPIDTSEWPLLLKVPFKMNSLTHFIT
jgi:hypothetical protein